MILVPIPLVRSASRKLGQNLRRVREFVVERLQSLLEERMSITPFEIWFHILGAVFDGARAACIELAFFGILRNGTIGSIHDIFCSQITCESIRFNWIRGRADIPLRL